MMRCGPASCAVLIAGSFTMSTAFLTSSIGLHRTTEHSGSDSGHRLHIANTAKADSTTMGVKSVRPSASFGLLVAVVAGAAIASARKRGTHVCSPMATRKAAAAEVKTEKAAPKPKAKAKAKAKAKGRKPKPTPPMSEQLQEGIFAPLIAAGYAVVGEQFVGKVRGKGIALHFQAITAFCQTFAINNKKRQGFIKTAKKTGHDLGFLIPGGYFGDGALGEPAMQWWKESGVERW